MLLFYCMKTVIFGLVPVFSCAYRNVAFEAPFYLASSQPRSLSAPAPLGIRIYSSQNHTTVRLIGGWGILTPNKNVPKKPLMYYLFPRRVDCLPSSIIESVRDRTTPTACTAWGGGRCHRREGPPVAVAVAGAGAGAGEGDDGEAWESVEVDPDDVAAAAAAGPLAPTPSRMRDGMIRIPCPPNPSTF